MWVFSVLVRVYVVRAMDLHPKDLNGKSDPYIKIVLGKTTISDSQNYISKQLNPTFGRMFEIKATFPFETLLRVQVWDWDLVGKDDIIGETTIDLENRYYSYARATCALTPVYYKSGPSAWRDASRPSQILQKLCRTHNITGPFFFEDRVKVGGKMYMPENLNDIEEDRNEHMSLYLLNNWDTIISGQRALVKEHIETRLLMEPELHQVQGKVQMWVDLFPLDSPHIPPPVNIEPRKPKAYEIRCIIWNTDEVILEDEGITGEKMSDIYVKGWVIGVEDSQSTDVHYRSLTGEGNFNWRFVFGFNYLSAEQRIVVIKKESVLSWDESETKLPAKLTLQVWDADHFSADDFLGSIDLDLNAMPKAAKTSELCGLPQLEPDHPTFSLFKMKRVKGWWPFAVKNDQTQEMELVGKVEAEISIVTGDEAEKTPVGLGRDEPEPLDKPNRPDTSFVWFMSPWKSLKYVLCTRFKWLFIKFLIISAILALFVLFIYSSPSWIAKKMLGA